LLTSPSQSTRDPFVSCLPVTMYVVGLFLPSVMKKRSPIESASAVPAIARTLITNRTANLHCIQRLVKRGKHNLAFTTYNTVDFGRISTQRPGGERAAAIDSPIGSAILNSLDLEAYLCGVLTCIARHPINRWKNCCPLPR